MIKVIGVRFRQAGKVYFFDPMNMKIEKGQHVIVETARGVEYGNVVLGIREVEDDKVVLPLKPVIRIATAEDDKKEEANRKKVLFYFTADGRIDFRELVKDLAAVFRTRIELRQIGVRDETKIRGGIGICGRVLCCQSYLSEFIPVSIKMAKEQNLSLNPAKISGMCGRLMCCLKNEQDTYEYLNSRLPDVGDKVSTKDGMTGEVYSVNVLRQKIKIIVTLENGEKDIKEYKVDEIKFKPKKRRNNSYKEDMADAEIRALEELERKEGKSKLDDN